MFQRNKNKLVKQSALSSVLLLASAHCFALDSLDDSAMRSVTGQDGLTVDLSGDISADSARFMFDSTDPDKNEFLSLDGIAVSHTGSEDYLTRLKLDVGADAGGVPVISLSADIDRHRMVIEGISISHDDPSTYTPSSSLGSVVFDAQGSLSYLSRGGLFNASAPNAMFDINIQDAEIFYKQGGEGTPELVWDNFNFSLGTGGNFATVGIDDEGFLVDGTSLPINFVFDLKYRSDTTGSPFSTASGTAPLLRYGWEGTLADMNFRIRPGGIWYGLSGGLYDTSNRSEGINLGFRTNFDSDFAWVVGEAASNTSIRFGNWAKLPGAVYGFDFNNITLDTVHAGAGPGGLCWGANVAGPNPACSGAGGTFMNLPAEDGSLAILVRDGKLHTYSQNVTIIDPPNPDDTLNWGLIYTFGDMDANILLKPGTATSTTGITADILAQIQTHDGWDTGTHLMIGDTDAMVGIGVMNVDALYAAKGLELTLEPEGVQLATDLARIRLSGLFGGGDLPSMAEPIRGFQVDANFEFDYFKLLIQPAVGAGSLGYAGALSLTDLGTAYVQDRGVSNASEFVEDSSSGASDDGSFIALAEPGAPSVDIRFAQASGDLEVLDGKVDVVPFTESAISDSQLVIEQRIRVGNSVTPVAGTNFNGDALTIGRVEFANRNLGKIVMPGGEIFTSFSLQRQ